MKQKVIMLAILTVVFFAKSLRAEENIYSYNEFKNNLRKNYNISYDIPISFLAQYGAPNGKQMAFQSIYAPSVYWNIMDEKSKKLQLVTTYSITQYSGMNGDILSERLGIVTDPNSSTNQDKTFPELYLDYLEENDWGKINIGVGQYPIYNFDGTAYDSDQQINFINKTFNQNASASYSTAGIGTFAKFSAKNDWNLLIGVQDASNIDGNHISSSHLDEGHFTTFGALSYTPKSDNWGKGKYAVLLYNQPNVKAQPQTTNGWSVNFLQNLGTSKAIFLRANGVNGEQEEIDGSYVLGMVFKDPMQRNKLDQLGVAVGLNHLNESGAGEKLNNRYETLVETYMAFGIKDMATITPDIQLYFNPAVADKSNNALVFSLRASIFF